MDTLELNDVDNRFTFLNNLKYENTKVKLSFIAEKQRSDILTSFKKKSRTNDENVKKIFFKTCDKEGNNVEKRKWLIYEQNYFFCVYCVCFLTKKSNYNLFTRGINYDVTNGRLSQRVSCHEISANHILAEKMYLKALRESTSETAGNSMLRCKKSSSAIESQIQLVEPQHNDIADEINVKAVVKCVVKIIIFLTTHGISNCD